MNATNEDTKIVYDHLLLSIRNLNDVVISDKLTQLEVNIIALKINKTLRNIK